MTTNSFVAIKNIITGNDKNNSFVNKIVSSIKDHLPEGMSDTDKADMNISIANAVVKESLNILEVAHNDEIDDNLQMKLIDGTATHLLEMGWVGKFLLIWREIQRPIWGYCTLAFSFFWFFTDKVKMAYVSIPDPLVNGSVLYEADPITKTKLSIIFVIYCLVLPALFGERAIKNVIPLVTVVLSMFTGRRLVTKTTQASETKPLDLTPKG